MRNIGFPDEGGEGRGAGQKRAASDQHVLYISCSAFSVLSLSPRAERYWSSQGAMIWGVVFFPCHSDLIVNVRAMSRDQRIFLPLTQGVHLRLNI